MVLDSEKEVKSLVDHELTNIIQVAEAVLSNEGYRDHYLEDSDHKTAMEEFAGVLDAAATRLRASYNMGLAEQDIQYLSEFDPDNFHDDFSGRVKRAKNLAKVAESYIEETEGEYSGWISIEDIFMSYDGEVDIEGYENVNLRGDSSLNCVLSTLEDNTHRHGGNEATPYIKIHRGDVKTGEYVLDHWQSSKNEDYADHWSQINAEDNYTLLYWDDGEGLDEEYEDNPNKIFEKKNGENSGMGLHLAERIIESFDGEIEVLETHPEIPDDAGMKMAITLTGTTKGIPHLSS